MRAGWKVIYGYVTPHKNATSSAIVFNIHNENVIDIHIAGYVENDKNRTEVIGVWKIKKLKS